MFSAYFSASASVVTSTPASSSRRWMRDLGKEALHDVNAVASRAEILAELGVPTQVHDGLLVRPALRPTPRDPSKTSGGEGIRTPGSLRYGGFQNRCLRPLGHSSKYSKQIHFPPIPCDVLRRRFAARCPSIAHPRRRVRPDASASGHEVVPQVVQPDLAGSSISVRDFNEPAELPAPFLLAHGHVGVFSGPAVHLGDEEVSRVRRACITVSPPSFSTRRT
jgi:hypothetical protein